MLLLKKIIAGSIPILLILAIVLSNLSGILSIVGYAISSILLSLIITLFGGAIYYGDSKGQDKKPRKIIVIGIIFISLVFGFVLFTGLMGIDILVVYNSTSKYSIVNIDNKFTIIAKDPKGEHEFYSGSFSLYGGFSIMDREWEPQNGFSGQLLGISGAEIKIPGHKIIYYKNRRLLIDGQDKEIDQLFSSKETFVIE